MPAEGRCFGAASLPTLCKGMKPRAQVHAYQPKGMVIVSQAMARGMIDQRRGKIINIASLQSKAARQSIAHNKASKGAEKKPTKGMSNRLGQAWFAVQRHLSRFSRDASSPDPDQ